MKFLLSLIIVSLAFNLTGCDRVVTQDLQSDRRRSFQQQSEKIFSILRKEGYGKAMPHYRAAADEAIRAGEVEYSVKFLNNLGGCQMATFQFAEALKTLTEARTHAEKGELKAALGALNSNISALLEQMGNIEAAAKTSERAAAYAPSMESFQRATVLAQVGNIQARIGRLDLAERYFAESINTALQPDDAKKPERTEENITKDGAEIAARSWDFLAYARLKAGKIADADTAAAEAFRMRTTMHLSGIDSSYKNLAMIRAEEGQISSALKLMNAAEHSLGKPGSVNPPWWIYLERGKIKLRAGDLAGAMIDLRRSRELARDWRVDGIANDANRTSLEGKLSDELYQYLIETGNRLYLSTGAKALIRETFEVAEENRAASLRALLPRSSAWRSKLDPQYYGKLSQLKKLETDSLAGASRRELASLRSELEEMESNAGGKTQEVQTAALNQAVQSLSANSALFSFQLGETESWLWVVKGRELSVHRLPARKQLAARIALLQKAAVGNTAELADLGAELYISLFGLVEAATLAREKWILLLDRELFELPFAVLSPSKGKFLIEDHSIRISSSALMMNAAEQYKGPHGGFLGVGDPIYNLADPRVKRNAPRNWPPLLTRTGYGQAPALARLWGTGREVETSANEWNESSNSLLKGNEATPEKFWAATRGNPEIIHFATHVLEGSSEPPTSWIAMSLGGNGQVQYITPEDILARSVSAKLVVLSGCSSGKADAPTATGLRGLTRAWIAAGAGAVLATRWPTVDDDGSFFQSFYGKLRGAENNDPAEALRRASLEVLKTKGWRSNPSFWAGYFLVGN